MYYQSYVNTALELIERFDGSVPLHHYLKGYFSNHKKFGSRDRKYISAACYASFRLGHAMDRFPVQERILTGIFLGGNGSNELLAHFKPEWNDSMHLSLQQKLCLIDPEIQIRNIFPWKEALSEGIDHDSFCRSFLVQPCVFLRIRPGNAEVVGRKLLEAQIPFSRIDEGCISVTNATAVDRILTLNKEAVVQDYASQQTLKNIYPLVLRSYGQILRVWDCCAGSGGKSIMLFDSIGHMELSVSDSRKSILANLRNRFRQAGLESYSCFLADLTVENLELPVRNADLIIADLPCSGSGTWVRTPESLYFFKEREIDRFSALQKKIIGNIVPAINKTGRLVYITCSVFKCENEDNVEFIKSRFKLSLERTEVLKGYAKNADTMFVASFTA